MGGWRLGKSAKIVAVLIVIFIAISILYELGGVARWLAYLLWIVIWVVYFGWNWLSHNATPGTRRRNIKLAQKRTDWMKKERRSKLDWKERLGDTKR